MMKADISIVQSKKGTEIMVSGNKINKYGILAAILLQYPYCSYSGGYMEKIWLMYHS